MKDSPIQNHFSRMFVRMPLYVSQWLRHKYMPPTERFKPIRLPWLTHPAGRIVYLHLKCNSQMKKLTPMCYSAQMFGIPVNEIPTHLRDLYPDDELRKEFVAIALPPPHIILGTYIEDDDTWQLDSEHVTSFNNILLEEMWTDLEAFWSDYRSYHFISGKKEKPRFFDAILAFCDFYKIKIDSFDALLRAYKRRRTKMKRQSSEQQASTPPINP